MNVGNIGNYIDNHLLTLHALFTHYNNAALTYPCILYHPYPYIIRQLFMGTGCHTSTVCIGCPKMWLASGYLIFGMREILSCFPSFHLGKPCTK